MTLEEKRAYRIGYQDGRKQQTKQSKKQQAVKEPSKKTQNLYIEYLRQSKEVI